MAEGGKKPAGSTAPAAATPIIKKIKKVSGGHHGGAWKVAYADFVTAMMAFFLLLWLLNVTTEEQRDGIASYFAPAIAISRSSGGAGVLGGDAPAATTTMSRSAEQLGIMQNQQARSQAESESSIDEKAAQEVMAKIEEEQFEQAENDLRQAIQEIPDMQQLAESLMIDRTPEGLRIQLVDQDKRSMFPIGSDKPYEHTLKLLNLVAQVVNKMPNKIAISGHTDSTPFSRGGAYGNWELSTDRANAARRQLIAAGVSEGRLNRIMGRADTEHLDKDANSPRNRRISILLLRDVPYPPASKK